MRLFIIGNGFDLDHNLKTTFNDFKVFLEDNYLQTFNKEFAPFPNVGLGKDGEEVVDPNSSSGILYALVSNISQDSYWKDFEKCLGELNYQDVLDYVEEDDEKPFNYYYNLEDIAENLGTSLLFATTSIFSEWINQISISKIKKKYSFYETDLFLTFNYTSVLEDVYGIHKKNICHIHGSSAEGVCIIGHGNDKRPFDDYKDVISYKVNCIHDALRKRVDSLYESNLDFFGRVYFSDVTEIVFFGFSFNEIDLFYLKQMFLNMNTDSQAFYLSLFEHEHKKEREAKIKILRELGYNGKYCGAFKKHTCT